MSRELESALDYVLGDRFVGEESSSGMTSYNHFVDTHCMDFVCQVGRHVLPVVHSGWRRGSTCVSRFVRNESHLVTRAESRHDAR